MKIFPRCLMGGLLVAAPVALILPGCSGGSLPGLPFPTATPKPTNATPVPTATAAPAQTSNLTLGNGQRAILITRVSGTALTGTLQILSPTATSRAAQAFNFNIGTGTYAISGTFTPPRGYSFSGNFPAPIGAFSMSGQLPTATQTGSYTLTAAGQTESGIVPVIGTPTATPKPTVTPTTAPGGTISQNLTFTASSDSNFGGESTLKGNVKGGISLVSAANIIGGSLQNDVAIGKDGVFLAFPGLTATQGSTVNIMPRQSLGYIYNYTPTGQLRVFVSESGTVTLTSLTATTAIFTFSNVVYAANEGNIARGKVTVNGTVSGPVTRA